MTVSTIYTLFGSVKHDPYEDHVVGVFSSVEKAVQRAQAVVAQDEYDRFCVMQHELDGDAESQMVKMMPVGHVYHVQVTHENHIMPLSVQARNQEEVFRISKQQVVDHFAAKGVRVFQKHMQVTIVYCDQVPVLIHT